MESLLKATFWTCLDSLIQSTRVVVDRPKGSTHPRYPSIVYPLDYGYLEGTTSGDGAGIDIWRGSLPEGQLDAIVCTVDVLKRDVEIKLLLGCTAEEQDAICGFHNDSESMAATLIKREE